MSHILLDSGPLRLTIDPALGAGVAGFSLRRRDGSFWPLFRPTPPGATHFNQLASYILAPWPNRIATARLAWRGCAHTLTPDWPDGSAIHGLVKDKPWRLTGRSPVSATLEFDSTAANLAYPWPFHCRALYLLGPDSLTTDLRLTALPAPHAPGPMPAGLGFHPFFNRVLWDPRDRVAIRCSLRGRYPTDAMIPTGPAAPDAVTARLAAGDPLGELALDDVFLGSSDSASIHWPASGLCITFDCSPALGHTVLYTGIPDDAGRMPPFFCLEPVTMVNDGFSALARGVPDTGVAELLPGQVLRARWTMRIRSTLP